MMLVRIFTVVLCLVCVKKTYTDTGEWEISYMHNLIEIAVKTQSNYTWKEAWHINLERAYNSEPIEMRFNCDIISSLTVPTSVHTLRPSDIKVIGALGGSITSAQGLNAKKVTDLRWELRGESWSVGGDGSIHSGIWTLTNILRKFNPNLLGFSTGTGQHDSNKAWLNRARPGATILDMMEQANELIDKLKNDNQINFEDDWKLVTIMVGNHDACQICNYPDLYTPEEYIRMMREVLDHLEAEVPRLLVNVVAVMDFTAMVQASDNVVCDIFTRISCPCGAKPVSQQKVRTTQLQYFGQLRKLIESGRYDTTDEFTVVLQPHLVNLGVPRNSMTGEINRQFFSPDCIHPSVKGHQYMAYMLWNTMLVPVGEKPLRYPVEEKPTLKCPTSRYPYIMTNRNSINIHAENGNIDIGGIDGFVQDTDGGSQAAVSAEEQRARKAQFNKILVIALVAVGGILIAAILLGIIIPLIIKKKKPKDTNEDIEEEIRENIGLGQTQSLQDFQRTGPKTSDSQSSLASVTASRNPIYSRVRTEEEV